MDFLLKKLNIGLVLILVILLTGGIGTTCYVFAASTPTFNQVINAGTLAVDIVNSSYVTVGAPTVTMGAVATDIVCLSGANRAAGTLGAAETLIYVKNPDAADLGWDVTIAPTAGDTAVWTDGGSNTYDFNDGVSAGCADGADADTKVGQMTVDASVGTRDHGQFSDNITAVTLGTSASFQETGSVVSSITILTGAAGSDDIGDWQLTGVSIKQTIPAAQPATSYSLPMTLTITAKS